jgi:hypothetical protein
MESMEGNTSSSNLFVGRYVLDTSRVLADGTFGPILKGFDTKWKTEVAITKAEPVFFDDIFEPERFKAILHEIRMLKIVRTHPNVRAKSFLS